MTILQRAATLAAVTFAFAGLAGFSTPGRAAETGQADPVQLSPAVLVQSATTPGAPIALPSIGVEPLPAAPAAIDPAPAAEPEAARFASLTEAIDANRDSAGDEATACLAGAIYFEAQSEPVEGQLAVAEVIINRAKSGRFPADVCGVVKQPGQFSFVHGGAIPDIDPARAHYRTAVAVAKVALAKAWEGGAPRALFFHARRVPPSARWVKVAEIGNHVFYR